jgi:hypothetical protein
LTTTPGRLRIESVFIMALAVLTGLFASFVVGRQVSDTRQIKDESAPAIVNARQVQASLAEANAAAAVAFLAGGVENTVQRQIYEDSLATAAIELESAARLIGDDDEAHEALAAMAAALPRYAGLIEAARANNRQGFPVGAAYLSSATTLLDEEIYPATDLVANRAAARYRDAYDRERGFELILGVLVAGTGALLVLVLLGAQLQLRRRFNRTLNGPMALATAATIALVAWLAYGFVAQTTHLTAARTDGYVGTRLYLDLRSSAFGAKADEAQFLIARGAGASFEDSFGERTARIDELRADLEAHAGSSDRSTRSGQRVTEAYGTWTSYLDLHGEVVSADRDGDRDLAVRTALGPSVESFAQFDTITSSALAENRERFDSEMAAAERALRGLQYGSLAAFVVIAALAAYGLQLRINEYR